MKGQAKVGLLVIVGVVLGVVAYGAGAYNRLVSQQEQVRSAASQVENVLQRRNDLIPNLVATVKGYAKHEQSVFGEISQALQSFNRATTVPEKLAANDTITNLLSRIMAVSLQYPNLKANESFNRLSDELAGTENRISVERRNYIEAVQSYNRMVRTFPTMVVARLAGFSPAEAYFAATPSAHTAPQVQF